MASVQHHFPSSYVYFVAFFNSISKCCYIQNHDTKFLFEGYSRVSQKENPKPAAIQRHTSSFDSQLGG